MIRISLGILALITLLAHPALPAADTFKVTRVTVTVQNPIDNDEDREINKFISFLVLRNSPQDLVAAVKKELSDLERYETIDCMFVSLDGPNNELNCRLKRFPIVRGIRFKGTPLLILEKELKKRIPIKPGQVIDLSQSSFKELIKRAESSIKSYFEREGFFNANITTAFVPVAGVPANDILFIVKGGSYVRVRNVTVENELPISSTIITSPFRRMCSSIRNISNIFVGLFQGTKACYNRELETQTIQDVENTLADLGYVEAHLSIAKHFVETDVGPPKFMDLKITTRLGPKLITTFTFSDAQVLDVNDVGDFFRSLAFVEVFSRALKFNGPGAKYPEDETILVNQLREALTFRSSHIIDDSQINASVESLKETLRSRGYVNADVEVTKKSERGKWVRLDFKIIANAPTYITAIKLNGTNRFSYADVSKDRPLLIKPRGAFSSGHYTDFALENDTSLVRDFFRDQGYDSASVSPIIEQGSEGAELIFNIDSGPRKLVQQITFNKDDPKLTKKFIDDNAKCENPVTKREDDNTILTCTQMPFVESNINNDRQSLANLYKGNGYLNVDVESSNQEIDGKTFVEYNFINKKKAHVAELLIDGNIITRRHAIVRELGPNLVSSGSDLLTFRLDEGLTRLRRYNVFSKLHLDYEPVSAGQENYTLFLQIVEKPTFYIDTTLAFNTDRLFDVGIVMNERNLFGGLLQLRSELHFGLFIGRLSTFRNTFTWPRFFGTPMDIKIVAPDMLYESQPYRTPPQRHVLLRGSIGLEWQFLDKLFPGVEFQYRVDKWQFPFEEVSFFKDPAAAFLTLDGLSYVLQKESSLRGILKPSLSFVSLDDPFDPKEGVNLKGSLELSGRNLGAERHYEIFNFQGTGYITFGPVTFAGNLLVRRALIDNPLQNWWVLKYQADFDTLGGIKGPRAYDQGTIGIVGPILNNIDGSIAKDANGADLAPGYHPGNFMLQSTLEMRFPLIEKLFFGKLNGALFGDIGFVGTCDVTFFCFDKVGQLNAQGQNRQLGIAVGAGLRYLLPVGPISLDYGISPIHSSNGLFGRESRVQFQFGYPF